MSQNFEETNTEVHTPFWFAVSTVVRIVLIKVDLLA